MMRRDTRISQQGIEQVISVDASILRSEIQQALDSVQQRPVVSLTMAFPTVGVVRHG